MMFLQTPSAPNIVADRCGLTPGHAFVVLGVKTLSNSARLVKIRNPWGVERYTCDYNDDSPLWTPELRKEAGATAFAENDGLFFMTIEDYFSLGVSTIVSYDTSDWFSANFLMLNDKTVSPGSWSWCGATCTRHTLQITSTVAQTVYVTANSWDSRM